MILITGIAGYIGSHVAKQILENLDEEIVGIDDFSKGTMKRIETLQLIKKFKFYEQNLANEDEILKIFKENNITSIIHFAGSIEVFESMQNPLKYYQNNTSNTTNLIKFATLFGVKKFIFSSTAAVYGEPKTSIVTEESELCPINPYGRSKLMSEFVLRDTASANPDFSFVALRYFNVAGASNDGIIGQSYPNATHLIKVAAQAALGFREKMQIFGDDYDTDDGTCIRDYIHIEDLANAHIMALEYLECHKSDIFNIGYGKGFSVKEVIECMKKVTNVDFKVEISPRRAGDPAILISNPSKAKEKMGFKPRFNDLELICKSAYEWEKKLIKKECKNGK